ncbi:hypothetical protein PCANC_16409 [Puccinia coronata f. sp. avenae]|uniref:Uncharacterized protein n=1 Tax=Puccinia coronata f. sp. avenae TaxID=200324 RepID=A0A2N5SYF0_9BASI|nr:hypothetical protein PCANC_16409 [Puccinia coronata f. sp. avenae]
MSLCTWVPATGTVTFSQKPPIVDTRTRRSQFRHLGSPTSWLVWTLQICKWKPPFLILAVDHPDSLLHLNFNPHLTIHIKVEQLVKVISI